MNRIGFLYHLFHCLEEVVTLFCQDVDLGYTTLINTKSFIGIGTFFSDFDLPASK